MYRNDPDDMVVFIGGWQRRHWTATCARAVWFFWVKEWRVLLPMICATVLAIWYGAI